MAMSLWDLIQTYVDDTGATEAAILRRAGLGKGTFTAWRARGIPALPSRKNMLDLADALVVSYETVLMAILHDTKYLPMQAAMEEQRRLDDEDELLRRRHALHVAEHASAVMDEVNGNLTAAIELNRSLKEDGSIDPRLAAEAEAYLVQLDEQYRHDEAAYKGEPDDKPGEE